MVDVPLGPLTGQTGVTGNGIMGVVRRCFLEDLITVSGRMRIVND